MVWNVVKAVCDVLTHAVWLRASDKHWGKLGTACILGCLQATAAEFLWSESSRKALAAPGPPHIGKKNMPPLGVLPRIQIFFVSSSCCAIEPLVKRCLVRSHIP